MNANVGRRGTAATAVTSADDAGASANRQLEAEACVTGPRPAVTSSAMKTPRPTRSPSAKWTIPVSR